MVFYDPRGVVQNYVVTLLKSFETIVDDLIIVVNGDIQVEEKHKLEEYSTSLFIRENSGFDAGAYKDVFIEFCKEYNWEDYEELLLFNDTFYGPFFSWERIFDEMMAKEVDFWGLSRHQGSKGEYVEKTEITEHIQSYFILIRKNMFLHPSFMAFWDKLEYSQTLEETVAKFEIFFTKYFKERGFKYTSWTDILNVMYGAKMDTDYRKLNASIIGSDFPILKRKECTLLNYVFTKECVLNITETTDYPISYIIEDTEIRNKLRNSEPIKIDQLLQFCTTHKKLYIYGNGAYAKNIQAFLNDNGINIEANIVSDDQRQQENTVKFSDFKLEKDSGIIIALGKKNLQEVIKRIEEKFMQEQIFRPQFEMK